MAVAAAAKKNIKNICALTPLQEGMLFHSLYDPQSTAYLELTHYHVAGFLDVAAFEAAWNELVRRHDILRTVFVHKNVAEPLQVVLKERRIDFVFEDFRDQAPDARQSLLADRLRQARRQRFDLSKDCLMRLRVLQCGEDSFEVIWTYHHILLDGWSLGLLQEEFFEVYGAFLQKRAPRLESAPSFGQYVRWLKRQDTPRGLAYWREYLRGYDRAARLPMRSSEHGAPFAPCSIESFLSEVDTARLRELAANHRVTFNTSIQALWGVLFAGLSKTTDVVFAATVSGRPPELAGVERMVGLLINAIPLRVRFTPDTSLVDLWKAVQKDANASGRYHFCALADIQNQSSLRQDLFDHILVFENYPSPSAPAENAQTSRAAFVIDRFEHADHTNYPLTVQVLPGVRLGFRFIFNERRLAPEQVEGIASLLTTLTQRALKAPAEAVTSLIQDDGFARFRPQEPVSAGFMGGGSSQLGTASIPLTIAATFTADPVVPYIQWAGQSFGLEVEARLAPYNQVFQQLLDPNAQAGEEAGIRLWLIRFEDWLRDTAFADPNESQSHLDRHFEILTAAFDALAAKAANHWIGVFPTATHLLSSTQGEQVRALRQRWLEYLSRQANLVVLDFCDLPARFQVRSVFDAQKDKVGHLPFSDEVFAALGLDIARRLVSWKAAPYKVIVVDCDNTLWGGLCAEEGPRGVTIEGGYRSLQEFLVRRVESGFLLAISSKNEPSDVWSVFEQRSEMPVRRDHIVAHRINWRNKSENIREIASELKLGLDSFIFLDDSALECAEVSTHCPEVLTLRLPEAPETFALFLSHVWAFDRFRITAEDRSRTQLYQAEHSRERQRRSAVSLEHFLRSLDIRVYLSPAGAAQAARVAQLTQRTNQFNNSTIRRSDRDVLALCAEPGTICWVIHVADKFGDYGLSGVLIGRQTGGTLLVESLLLSCRVLGRRVEDTLLAALRQYCEKRGLVSVEMTFHPTERNGLVVEFLRRTGWQTEQPGGPAQTFRICADSLPKEVSGVCFELLPQPWQPRESQRRKEPVPAGSVIDSEKPSAGQMSGPVTLEWDVWLPDGPSQKLAGYYRMLQHANGSALLRIQADPASAPGSENSPVVLPENEDQKKMLRIWESVLGSSGIGIDHNFFELGGHSLKATRILSRVYQEFGCEISLKDIFEAPTVRQLSGVVADQHSSKVTRIPAVAPKPFYELSHAQRRLWILHQMEKESIAYNNSGFYLGEGPLDVDCLRRAFQAVVNRHDSLRTTFELVDGRPVQIVHDRIEWDIRHLDWRKEDTSLDKVRRFAENVARTPFDLSLGPLLVVYVIELGMNRFALLIHMHHIISDGWSMSVLEREVLSFYRTLLAGGEPSASPLRIQYKDYAAWHNSLLTGDQAARERQYWLAKLTGEMPRLDLPSDAPRPPVQTFNGSLLEYSVPTDLWQRFWQLGRERSATPFVLLLALVKVLLFRFTRQEDIIIGSPVAGRTHCDLDDQVGFFVNTLPLRDRLAADQSFDDVVGNVRRTVAEAFDHQLYPFDLIVQDVASNRDLSRAALLDVMLVVEAAEEGRPKETPLVFRPMMVDSRISRFDLTFSFAVNKTHLDASITYNSDLFSRRRISRLSENALALMTHVAAEPNAPIGRLNLLSGSEKRKLLEEFRRPPMSLPSHDTLADLFERQVGQGPDRTCLITPARQWTYRQLNERAEQLARYLNGRFHVQTGDTVAVMVEDRTWAVVSLLAIMKLGGVYLPLEVHGPVRRVQHIIRDSRCTLILTDPIARERLVAEEPVEQVVLDEVDWTHYSAEPWHQRRMSGENLAYLIYTSGSTGQPKGVLIEQSGFINMIWQQIAAFGVAASDRVLQFASLSFDASLSEIFMTLLSGAALCLPQSESIKDPDAFCEYLERTGITVATLPPVFLSALEGRPLRTLKTLITAGEAASPAEAARRSLHLRYFNAYGPTETSVCATFYEVPPGEAEQTVPIGKPLANLSVYIVDEAMQLVPLGATGEICVSGIGLSRGYLNLPELTAEKFIPNPFEPGQRLYRTGDRGRWREDGNLEFLGRADNQVKIRGHRVEMDEVKHHICSHPLVNAAAVFPTARTDATTTLAAYVVAGGGLDRATLRSHLAERIPDYAIPAHFVFLDSLPLNSSGKVDRKALPPVDRMEGAPSRGRAPENSRERELADIWHRVLGSSDLGIRDGFFEVGGDSITAIQVVSRLRKAGWQIEIKDLYLHPTIEQLARLAPKAEAPVAPSPEPISGAVALTPIQRWFFTEYPFAKHHFNHSELLYAPDRFNEEAVARVFAAIQNHHDALRMRFGFEPGGTVTQQNNGLDHPFSFELVDLRGELNAGARLEEHADRVHASLDLEKGPLMKVVLYRGMDGDRLLVIIHHLVVDAVSWRIILEDFSEGYRQYLQDGSICLAPKTDSFQKWALAVQDYSGSRSLLEEIPFWKRIEATPVIPLTFDGSRDGESAEREGCVQIGLPERETGKLTARLRAVHGVGMVEGLLASLAFCAGRRSRSRHIPILLESHGRESIAPGLDVSRTVGWFTAVYPVVLECPDAESAAELVERTQRALQGIPKKGIGHGILKWVTSERLKQDLRFELKPQISFNYLGFYGRELSDTNFRLAKEAGGRTSDAQGRTLYDLTFNAVVTDGKLRLFLAFDSARFSRDDMAGFLAGYREQLRCLSGIKERPSSGRSA